MFFNVRWIEKSRVILFPEDQQIFNSSYSAENYTSAFYFIFPFFLCQIDILFYCMEFTGLSQINLNRPFLIEQFKSIYIENLLLLGLCCAEANIVKGYGNHLNLAFF
jgi:hypothetical protein